MCDYRVCGGRRKHRRRGGFEVSPATFAEKEKCRKGIQECHGKRKIRRFGPDIDTEMTW